MLRQIPSSNGAWLGAQAISLTPGSTYRLAIWVRGQRAAGSCSVLTATISLQQASEPYAAYGAVADVLSSQWAQLVVPRAQVPGNPTDPPVPLLFMVSLNAPGTIWMDTAELYMVQPSDPLEQLSNPGMEGAWGPAFYLNAGKVRGSLPVPWTDSSAADPSAQVLYAQDLTSPQAGSSSLKAVIAGGALRVGQRLLLSPGGAYQASIWMRGQPPAGSTAVLRATLALRQDGGASSVYSSATVTLGRQWTQLSLPLVELPGKPSDPLLPCLFSVTVEQRGTVWLDSATLMVVEMLANPSLEAEGGWYAFTSNGCNLTGTQKQLAFLQEGCGAQDTPMCNWASRFNGALLGAPPPPVPLAQTRALVPSAHYLAWGPVH
jgi:hypothetical protein